MSRGITDSIVSRKCAVCGASRTRTLYHQTFAKLDTSCPFDGYDVVTCNECGFVYADRIPEQAALDAYYRDMSKYEGRPECLVSEFDERRFQKLADILERGVSGREANVLEVGCATGRLLAILKERGFLHVHGLDPAPSCSRTARALYGVEVTTGSILSHLPPGDGYDLVILIGVLEHIRDLAATLNALRGMLKPGGRLFVEVPDAGAFISVPDAAFQQFSIEHINFFSGLSLSNLMHSHRFTTVASDTGVWQASDTTFWPAAYGFYEAGEGGPVQFDSDAVRNLEAYILRSRKERAGIMERLAAIPADHPIIVWGVGTHTLQLLAAGAMARLRIAAFVDSNPKYQAGTLDGVPVLGPADLKRYPDFPVLISSRVSEREILAGIRNLGFRNEVILLYTDEQENRESTPFRPAGKSEPTLRSQA